MQAFVDWPLVEGSMQAWHEWRQMQEEREMMSLQPYLPPQSGEAGAVFGLLQVIGDPKAAKAVLDKLIEERKAIDNATERQREEHEHYATTAKKARAEYEKIKHETEATAAKAASEFGQASTTLALADRRKAEVAAMEKHIAEQRVDIEERAKQLEASEAELNQHWRSIKLHESDLETREQKMEQREADLALREKTLADDIAEHNKWLAGLKPPRAR